MRPRHHAPTCNLHFNPIIPSESVLGRAKQEDPGVGGDTMIGRLHLDQAIECGFKKVTLLFSNRKVSGEPSGFWTIISSAQTRLE